jgi:Na+/melibiose symporter-like transporter
VWTSFKTREVLGPPPNQDKVTYRQMFQTLFSNRYIIIITLGMFAMGIFSYGCMTMGVYYFQYVCNKPSWVSIMSILQLAGTVLGAGFLGSFLYGRLKNKGRAMAMAQFTSACCSVIKFLFIAPHPLFWIMTFAAGLAGGASAASGHGMTGDAVDVGEFKTGVRCDGFLTSFTSTAMKLGGAIGPTAGAAMLSVMRYVPNQAQPPEIIRGINAMYNLMPAVCLLSIGLLYIVFYDLDETKHEAIRQELERRRR